MELSLFPSDRKFCYICISSCSIHSFANLELQNNNNNNNNKTPYSKTRPANVLCKLNYNNNILNLLIHSVLISYGEIYRVRSSCKTTETV